MRAFVVECCFDESKARQLYGVEIQIGEYYMLLAVPGTHLAAMFPHVSAAYSIAEKINGILESEEDKGGETNCV